MDRIDAKRRSENMRKIRSKGMKPELAVRRLVWSLGFRYRLHASDLLGKPDLVFRSKRRVIFVHGCFWHCHGCKRAHEPRSNTGYWSAKLQRNRTRDKATLAALRRDGWKPLVVWECQTKDPKKLTRRLEEFFLDRRRTK